MPGMGRSRQFTGQARLRNLRCFRVKGFENYLTFKHYSSVFSTSGSGRV